MNKQHHHDVEGRQGREARPMGSHRFVLTFLLLDELPRSRQPYGVGRAPTAAERAQDITISPTGAGLPAKGHGTAAEGKVLFTQKNCVGQATAPKALEGVSSAPNLQAKKGPDVNAWLRGNGGDDIPVKRAKCDYRVGFHPLRECRAQQAQTFTPNQVYALTAYLLALANKIIPQDQILDQNNLAKVKMPIGNEWA